VAEKRALPIARQIQNDGSNKVFVPFVMFSAGGSFGFRRALYVTWVCFAWFYFMLKPFFFFFWSRRAQVPEVLVQIFKGAELLGSTRT
jgi:hypothetical protein